MSILSLLAESGGKALMERGAAQVAERGIAGRLGSAAARYVGSEGGQQLASRVLGPQMAERLATPAGQKLTSMAVSHEAKRFIPGPKQEKPQSPGIVIPNNLTGGTSSHQGKGWWNLQDKASEDWRTYRDRTVARGPKNWDLPGHTLVNLGKIGAATAFSRLGQKSTEQASGSWSQRYSGKAPEKEAAAPSEPRNPSHTLTNVRPVMDVESSEEMVPFSGTMGTQPGMSYYGTNSRNQAFLGGGTRELMPGGGEDTPEIGTGPLGLGPAPKPKSGRRKAGMGQPGLEKIRSELSNPAEPGESPYAAGRVRPWMTPEANTGSEGGPPPGKEIFSYGTWNTMERHQQLEDNLYKQGYGKYAADYPYRDKT